MEETMEVCGKEYRVVRLLGHGKGGYSYLAEADGRQAVVKQIHHEPCDYYAFGNKIEAEKRDYGRLMQAGIRIPELIAIDEENERVAKEYIEGETVCDLVRNGGSAEAYLPQVREMAARAKAAGLNIDYFPTNFVIRDGLIWYVDYECNEYMDEWNFENWGIRYWSRTPEFLAYVKEQGENRLSETEIRRWLRTERLGRELEIHPLLDSTNNRAKRLAARGAAHGTTVIADSQSGGRGRMGRSFFSPEHSGIYMTVILRPEWTPDKAGLLTSMAAVAAARAVEKVSGADVKIKWVNDLYVGGRKICGILSEAGLGTEAGRPDWAIVGIGINTARMTFPEELKEIASSVGNETGTEPDRNRLIAEVLNELDALYDGMETGAFLEESRRRSNVIGREVTVIEGGKQYPARVLDIDDEGRLVIETEEGETRLDYGEVSLKLPGRNG